MSNGGLLPGDLPPFDVTVSDVTQNEVDFRAQSKQQALGQKDAGWFSNIWANLWASIKRGTFYVVNEFAIALDEVMAFVGQFFRIAQGENNAAFYDLSGAILEDLTGVKVDTAALKNSAFGSGRLAAMQTFGGDLYNLLAQEFAPASGDLEAGDDAPAKRFLGFLMNFAIRQGNIENLCQMLPESIRIGEGFRAYGELMAKNLGLGRMARRALQPLIQIQVADPLMYKLQEQYRPKRIGVQQAIRKFFRTPDFEQQMRKEIAQEGYTDARTNDLIDDLRPLLSARELFEYTYRVGAPFAGPTSGQTQSLHDFLMQRGYSSDDADRLIAISHPILEKNEIGVLFTNGVIDHDLASSYLGKLGYDNDTAELVLRAHSLQHQRTHRLGLGELKKAFHNNVIDLLELKAHLSAQGYSDDDIQIITLDLLQPVSGKVRQLSLAEIKAGFKAGALTEQQAAEHLKTLGYSDADIAVIVKTLTPPKVAAPTGSAPGTAGSTPAATP
jgi:hypothetical protein